MGMLRLVVVGALATGLLACQAARLAGSGPMPKPDLSTPERALRSYWALKDWYFEAGRRADEEVERRLPEPIEVYGAVSTGEARAYWSEPWPRLQDKRQRDIEAIMQEAESRAVALVRVRNVTPIPPGVHGSPQEVERREAGVMFRFLLEREGGEWKISQIWRDDGPMQGWTKQLDRGEPYYPSAVFGH